MIIKHPRLIIKHHGIIKNYRYVGDVSAPPGGLRAPWASPLMLPWLPSCRMVPKKSTRSFVAFGLHLVLIFCKVKNKQKNSNWHYANWLVPKNDIKLQVNVYETSKIDHITSWNNQKL